MSAEKTKNPLWDPNVSTHSKHIIRFVEFAENIGFYHKWTSNKAWDDTYGQRLYVKVQPFRVKLESWLGWTESDKSKRVKEWPLSRIPLLCMWMEEIGCGKTQLMDFIAIEEKSIYNLQWVSDARSMCYLADFCDYGWDYTRKFTDYFNTDQWPQSRTVCDSSFASRSDVD